MDCQKRESTASRSRIGIQQLTSTLHKSTEASDGARIMRVVAGLGLAALLLAGGPSHARAGTDRFVASGGADTGDCSAEGNPCATMQHAIGQAAAGDNIRVA